MTRTKTPCQAKLIKDLELVEKMKLKYLIKNMEELRKHILDVESDLRNLQDNVNMVLDGIIKRMNDGGLP